MKKALIFGASGFIGSYLLKDLLNHSQYEKVTVVVRKPLSITHSKLNVLMGDLNSLANLKKDLIADDVFIALGTTKKKTPNPDEFYKVDHDYPVLAAKLAKENGASSVFLVSAVGADPNSKSSYIRIKGETERDIIALGFRHTHIFRPSMLLGNREEHRSLEKVVVSVMPFIEPFLIGKLKSFKGIEGKDLALAMVNAAQKQIGMQKIYEWSEMQALVGRAEMSEYQKLIEKAYEGFNARDISKTLSTMDLNVKWPKAFEGGYVSGHAEVRSYWERQWSEINPIVKPRGFRIREDGRFEVEVDQLVKDLDGKILFEGKVFHVYTIERGKLMQMDIEMPKAD